MTQPQAQPPHPSRFSIKDLVQEFGDSLYRLCLLSLEDPILARESFRVIIKRLAKDKELRTFQQFRKAWILKLSLQELRRLEPLRQKHSRHEAILDHAGHKGEMDRKTEHERFLYYFYRLSFDDRASLILKHCLSATPDESAAVFSSSTSSLQFRLDSLLRRLTEQVYDVESANPDHRKKIEKQLASMETPVLPAEGRADPLSRKWIHSKDLSATRTRLKRWRQQPWYVRTGVEGASIVLMVLLTVVAVPKLRAIYEHTIDRRIEVYQTGNLLKSFSNEVPEATLEQSPDMDEKNPEEVETKESTPDSGESEVTSDGPVRIQEGEIWRFYIRTESPRDIRPKIQQLLKTLDLGEYSSNAGGLEAPGGIQFDLLVPKDNVTSIKQEMDKLAQSILHDTGNLNLNLNQVFTWFRSKSKKPIPSGKTRIIIWLSQI